MKFVRERTSIPVPKVLAHHLDQSNELGGAYMLLEKARPITTFLPIILPPPFGVLNDVNWVPGLRHPSRHDL
jgi:hypothetical protein